MASTTKRTLIALALVFTVINGGLVLAANEQYAKLHSAFGIEDPDPDLDGVYMNDDKCSASPFDLWILNKNTKKQKGTAEFADPKNPSKSVYLRLKKINNKKKDGNNDVVLEASTDQKFSKAATKPYTLSGNKITTVDLIGKRFRALYVNSQRGTAIVWSANLAAKKKGCTIGE